MQTMQTMQTCTPPRKRVRWGSRHFLKKIFISLYFLELRSCIIKSLSMFENGVFIYLLSFIYFLVKSMHSMNSMHLEGMYFEYEALCQAFRQSFSKPCAQGMHEACMSMTQHSSHRPPNACSWPRKFNTETLKFAFLSWCDLSIWNTKFGDSNHCLPVSTSIEL